MKKLIFLDTETWWLDSRVHALLTIAYTITNELYEVLDSKEYKVPINGEITDKALECNWLDVTDWKPNNTVDWVINELIDNLWDYDATLLGHNIQFDLWFIKEQSQEAYDNLISRIKRSIIDTKSLVEYLKLQGKYDGSTSMHKFINAPVGNHEAQQDTIYNIDLLKKVDSMI